MKNPLRRSPKRIWTKTYSLIRKLKNEYHIPKTNWRTWKYRNTKGEK